MRSATRSKRHVVGGAASYCVARRKPALPHPSNPNPEPNPEPDGDEVAGVARLKLIEEQKLLKRLAAGPLNAI